MSAGKETGSNDQFFKQQHYELNEAVFKELVDNGKKAKPNQSPNEYESKKDIK